MLLQLLLPSWDEWGGASEMLGNSVVMRKWFGLLCCFLLRCAAPVLFHRHNRKCWRPAPGNKPDPLSPLIILASVL